MDVFITGKKAAIITLPIPCTAEERNYSALWAEQHFVLDLGWVWNVQEYKGITKNIQSIDQTTIL